MNALYLKDLAEKTRRGLRGRIETGKSGGGNSYGYDVVKKIGDNGEPIRGERRINPQQATIVIRIYVLYAQGVSPRAIAKQLNREGVPSPSGKGWGPSTIHSNWHRGTGILNNEARPFQLIELEWRRVLRPLGSCLLIQEDRSCDVPSCRSLPDSGGPRRRTVSCPLSPGAPLMQRRELLRMQVRFPPDVHRWLRAQAERNMSSINAEIIRCVRDAMDRQVPCTTPPHDRPGAAS